MLNHRLVLSRQTVVVHCFSLSLSCTDCPAVTKFIDTKWKKVYSWQKVTYFFVYTRCSPSSSESLLAHDCSSQKHCWSCHPYLSHDKLSWWLDVSIQGWIVVVHEFPATTYSTDHSALTDSCHCLKLQWAHERNPHNNSHHHCTPPELWTHVCDTQQRLFIASYQNQVCLNQQQRNTLRFKPGRFCDIHSNNYKIEITVPYVNDSEWPHHDYTLIEHYKCSF